MNVTVIVPWRGTDPARLRAHEHVTTRLREMLPDADHTEADDRSRELFSRAGSRNLGVAQAVDADVVVVCDADTIPQREPLLAAIRAAHNDGVLHTPYTRFRGLTEAGTAAYLAGRPADECDAELDWLWSFGGVFVIRPAAWFDAGGMDERFHGWGAEDLAFSRAAETLLGPTRRHPGIITHLWHPTSPPADATWALADRYARATGDPAATRALIAERNPVMTWPSRSSS